MFLDNNSGFYPLCYEKYYPQIFLEECKYAKKNIKTKNNIDNELKSESDIDSDSDNSTNNEEYV